MLLCEALHVHDDSDFMSNTCCYCPVLAGCIHVLLCEALRVHDDSDFMSNTCCYCPVLAGCIHVLLCEALRVHDDSADERARQAGHVQQHRAHQRPAAESAGARQQDGPTVSPAAHHHLQLSPPRQQSACRCLWSVV